MNEYRLTFLDPTNITIPIIIYNTLIEDCFHFGYIKNEQANISGFLNHLIPCLSDYREELHNNFLQSNENDEALTTKIEENLYKIYFNKYDYCDDGVIPVPFRVNKEHLQDFLDIVDGKLFKYNMDFSTFVRSLLIEYASKRLNQREYFFYFRQMNKIKTAITQNRLCHFYTNKEKNSFIPVSIEIVKNREFNILVGINIEQETAYILPLHCIKRVVITEESAKITREICDFIYDSFEEYCEEEERKENK